MNVNLLSSEEINPEKWDNFVFKSPQGNIYHLHQYLNNLIPVWQAVIATEGNEIIAAMPFQSKLRYQIKFATQPFFAQYLGILFNISSENKYKELELKKKIIQEINTQLPSEIKYINYNFAPEFDYELPLIWSGWIQRKLYTYWLDIRAGYDSFIKNAASHVRREIKKIEQSTIEIRETNDPDSVIHILKTAKGSALSNIPQHYFNALAKNSKHYNLSGKSTCFIAYDGEKAVAGIIYFLFKNKMIYYQGSTLPEYKNSGAMSAIIATSIKKYAGQFDYLDFDGSMIEPIERFFRGFGAYPVSYSNFSLNRLPFLAGLIHSWMRK